MNAEQTKAFERVKKGENVFITGSGGVGKSYCLGEIIKWARSSGFNIGVTATTGAAAILIKGTTVHSYLGIGVPRDKTPQQLADAIKYKKRFVYNRLLKLEILIIDEISMMDSKLFDTINLLLRIIKGNNLPFGGVQLVICGDLFQLPPIENNFFFKSEVWPIMDIQLVELIESQRQKNDIVFQNILRKIRLGECDEDILKTLKQTKHNQFDIMPTVLYTKNIDVDKVNTDKYDELVNKGARSFDYHLKTSSEGAKVWANSCKIPDICRVCVGAQVVLTWNIDIESGLCNGTRGVITDVGVAGVTVKLLSGQVTMITYNRVESDDDKNNWMMFMPLRLAYALTVNKSQGMTLDSVIVHLDKNTTNVNFLYGRSYTALSRVRDLKSLQIINVSLGSFVAHPDVIEFYNNMCSN